jgi:hypothetical protein
MGGYSLGGLGRVEAQRILEKMGLGKNPVETWTNGLIQR